MSNRAPAEEDDKIKKVMDKTEQVKDQLHENISTYRDGSPHPNPPPPTKSNLLTFVSAAMV